MNKVNRLIKALALDVDGTITDKTEKRMYKCYRNYL